MDVKWPVLIAVGLMLLVGAVAYLAQAVEPPRATAVEVLDHEQFAR